MYLDTANRRVENTATLDAMKIKHDHEQLAKFAPMECMAWDDDDYPVDILHYWGQPDTVGYTEMRTLVETWIQNIKLGAVAREVLTDYIDCHLHCFDNEQNCHPSKPCKEPEQAMRTGLASYQAKKLGCLQDKHMTCPNTTTPGHVHSNKCRQPLEGKTLEEVKESCT